MINERRWIVEWRVRVRSRLEGDRDVTLVQFARSADGARRAADHVIDSAIDGEVRLRIESGNRTLRRPPIITDRHGLKRWDATAPLPSRLWESRWAEAERNAYARTLVGIDFEEATRRAVHARLIDDAGAAALLDAIEAALAPPA
jgi:hypothetical protein